MKYAYLLLFFVIVSRYAQAGSFSQSGTINEIYTSGSWTMVKIAGTNSDPDNCDGDINTVPDYYALNITAANYNALYSTLLSSQMAGKTIKFYLSGCAGQYNVYPQINSIKIFS